VPTLADQARELETRELVNRLVNSPGFEALGDKIEELREQYFKNLARGLASNSALLDQREIDYKRGFWQGAMYVARRLPKQLAKDWEVLVAAAEEGEDTV